MYFTTIRPDIMYAISLVSRFMETPKETHWQAAKIILKYVNGTKEYGVFYSVTNDFRLVGYTGSDWAGSVNDIKSTSGYVFHLGSRAISWASKKQPIMSFSTVESEYVTTTATMCQTVWMRRMLWDLFHEQDGATTIFCDNISTIALSQNYVFQKRKKKIDAKYIFIRELVNNGEITLQHCRSEEQFAKIFTKPLPPNFFFNLRDCLGMFNGCNYD